MGWLFIVGGLKLETGVVVNLVGIMKRRKNDIEVSIKERMKILIPIWEKKEKKLEENMRGVLSSNEVVVINALIVETN